MEATLHSTVLSSSKQRRRAVAKTERKFPVKDRLTKTALPTPATISKKSRKAVLFRFFAAGTIFFILVSTIALWRKRKHRIALLENKDPLKKFSDSLPNRLEDHGDQINALKDAVLNNNVPVEHAHHRTNTLEDTVHNNDIPEDHVDLNVLKDKKLRDGTKKSLREKETNTSTDKTKLEHHPGTITSSKETKHADSPVPQSLKSDVKQKLHSYDGPPNQIEWYTRDDYKEGKRPMCRISRPIVLSNGTILVPDWMLANEKLLHRCGLGHYGFYSSIEPAGVQTIVDIDADFALTIHLEKFQEPTHVPSVYLTEHVLKSSYLFDTFSGDSGPKDGVPQSHCIATEIDTKCELPLEKNVLKPGIFVPERVARGAESSWPRVFVNMLEAAHGNGNGIVHLNTSSILIKSHKKQSDNLTGTRFRSIMTTDGMFRHLPVGAFNHSSFFSAKNGISREKHGRKKQGKCAATIGLSASKDPSSGFDSLSELKEKLTLLSRFAPLHIDVKEIDLSSATGFEEHIKQMQDVDIFVAGSGDDMTSIGFLPCGSMVFELMPFGISPDTHRSLSRAMNVGYNAIKGKPNDQTFKQCIESEIFNLRKKGKLQFTESPAWLEPLMKSWDHAVGEFAMSGKSTFDILTSEEPVKNYYSKLCALKQKIEIGMEEAARQIIAGAKAICTST